MSINITFSTSWYLLSSKFPPETYQTWITNMLSCVYNYYLVIFTDAEGLQHLQSFAADYLNNPNIRVIIREMEDFYNYRYQNDWIRNHTKNIYLNQKSEWKLNMLWAEKVHMVKETVDNQYFDTKYYGWCDIGYFRNEPVPQFPSARKIEVLNKAVIYYACVNNDDGQMHQIRRNILQKNSAGLPAIPIEPMQVSVAGGFFILSRENVDWWRNTFDAKLQLYFNNQYLVKDDQMIVINCITENPAKFQLIKENSPNNWFLFQRFLS